MSEAVTWPAVLPTEDGLAGDPAPGIPEDNPEERGTTLIEVHDLAVALGGRRVLTGIRFQVGPGEFIGIIGPNGAGKTTLMRAILSLVPAEGGSILVDGRRARRGSGSIGYVPQRHEFMWDFPISVEDAVLTGRVSRIGWLRRARVEDYAAVADALSLVGMSDLRRRPVGELSGGQRQRVLVARALALRPRVLLLDEPFTGLDMPTQELLTDLFTTLSAQGTAIVMTTHDIVAAVHQCARLILINRRIIADGPPSDVTEGRLWKETFDVTDSNPLLMAVGAIR
ncbi:MAG: anchored repeat-type ABC transporter ATP-binding subunit [Actinomyces sp.]|jgi:manganese/iron transport system ATP-binding protein|nr:anchored repeat-type ABC transporter ATP-binding subunit [Actinomyces sp.]MCI1789025.1 anchored repeat-type ABC transporter ATP-binding subunit [Actinomyces sp.]MCI1830039.1 anchored repeat-type ABC transporter ATP-binding subunit [Actinomyces sp.]MCI1867418.1 anchored repeat-type ABC transporter ATP-binding subunit [Actinomyces sp.]